MNPRDPRPVLAVLLVTAAAWDGGYYLGVEDGRADLQHRLDELRLENRELLNELQQANGRSSSTALQQTRRVESLRETESYLRDQLERTRSELSETEQEALVTAFKYIWLNRVANETGEVDPDGDGVRSAVEVWYCYDPMNASETPPPGTDLSSDIESKCEESG